MAHMEMEYLEDPYIAFPAEIFEHVFLFLPLVDLIVMQRVSRHWKEGIEASIKAQQALFLKPYSNIRVEAVHNRWWEFISEEGEFLPNEPLLNPFMKDMVPCNPSARHNRCQYTSKSARLCIDAINMPETKWEAVLCKHRSDMQRGWMNNLKCSLYRMLPMQPPARYLVSRCPDRPNPPSPDYSDSETSDDGEEDGEDEEEGEEVEERREREDLDESEEVADDKEALEAEEDGENAEDAEGAEHAEDAGDRGALEYAQDVEVQEHVEDTEAVEAEEDMEDTEVEEGEEREESRGGECNEFDKDSIFYIKPHAQSYGLVRIGDMINECWRHFVRCRKENCEGIKIEEIEFWDWAGEDDVDLTFVGPDAREIDEITGHEMLAELEKRSRYTNDPSEVSEESEVASP